jgi:S-adenosylmethionine hydrolase
MPQLNNFRKDKTGNMKYGAGFLFLFCFLIACRQPSTGPAAIVVQTDFGVKDGAVAAMKGVASGVDNRISIVDLTHEIPAYNVWEAAYRLNQVMVYWPAKTVFVSVVDPGVGTERKSVVIRTRTGQYLVTPDNGTATLVAASLGIESVRLIDEERNRREGSDSSYTFHGRDVYMYTAARLAAGKISFEEVGPEYKNSLQKIPYQAPVNARGLIRGNIPVLDPQYGNVWTNVPDSLLRVSGIRNGDSLNVAIRFKDALVYSGKLRLANTFGAVAEGESLAYLNSLMNFSLAINMGSFAERFKIRSGPDWNITIFKE